MLFANKSLIVQLSKVWSIKIHWHFERKSKNKRKKSSFLTAKSTRILYGFGGKPGVVGGSIEEKWTQKQNKNGLYRNWTNTQNTLNFSFDKVFGFLIVCFRCNVRIICLNAWDFLTVHKTNRNKNVQKAHILVWDEFLLLCFLIVFGIRFHKFVCDLVCIGKKIKFWCLIL